jgi:hypothetical protein
MPEWIGARFAGVLFGGGGLIFFYKDAAPTELKCEIIRILNRSKLAKSSFISSIGATSYYEMILLNDSPTSSIGATSYYETILLNDSPTSSIGATSYYEMILLNDCSTSSIGATSFPNL